MSLIMFLLFSPFSYLFLLVYFFLITFLFSCFSFIFFWLTMELLMLVFIGVSYSICSSSFSSLILYFLIQTFSSFMIIISYLYDSTFFICISIMLKLSIFPFHFWFLSVVYRLPNFIFYISSSFHKLPVFLLIINFSLSFPSQTLLTTLLLSVLVSSFIMLSLVDFRIIILSSSVGNNSWFLLSSLTGFYCFMSYFMLYTTFLFGVVYMFGGFSKCIQSFYSPLPLVSFLVLLSGLPPFPLFYPNLFIVYYALNYIPSFFYLLFLVLASLILVGYLQSSFKFFIYNYSISATMFLHFN